MKNGERKDAPVNAERALVGSVILAGDLATAQTYTALVGPQDFYSRDLAEIWKVITSLVRHGTAPEVAILQSRLSTKHTSLLVGILSETITATHIDHYAKVVKDASLRRQINQWAQGVVKAVYEAESATEVMALAEKGLHTLTPPSTGVDAGRLAAKVVKAFHEGKKPIGQSIKAGVPVWDDVVGEMFPGYYIFFGVSHTGKTSISLQVALSVAKQGKGVKIYSLEMPADLIASRLLFMEAKVSSRKAYVSGVTAEERDRLDKAAETLQNCHIQIVDNMTDAYELAADLRLSAVKGVDFAVMDGLWLMEVRHADGDNQRIKTASRVLKQAIQHSQIPVIVTHQPTKELSKKNLGAKERRKPNEADLSYGGAQQDADVIVAVHTEVVFEEEMPKDPYPVQLGVLKNRLLGNPSRWTEDGIGIWNPALGMLEPVEKVTVKLGDYL